MKISRNKKLSKYLNFYTNNYGFRAPFQILIDGTYCFAALKNQHTIKDQLPKYFQSELKLLTTPCIIHETEQLGSKVFGAMIIVKQFAIHKCKHLGKPVPGSECIKSMLGPKNRYIVATQDRDLQNHIRTIPGTPLLYLHQKTPVLEHPSEVSENHAKNETNSRLNLSQIEAETLDQLKEQSGIINEVIPKKKRKKLKGPNPMSCKKKKKKPQINGNNNKVVKKRKRVRIPDHVRQELLNRDPEK